MPQFFLPTHAPVVGNIGALVPQKGQHHLIDAAAIVVRAVPDVRFVIVGEGELRPALEEQIKRKHLERHVFLAGFRADALELLKGVRPVRSELAAGRHVHVAGRRDGRRQRRRWRRASAGCPKWWSMARPDFWCPPRDHEAMAERHHRAAEGQRSTNAHGRSRPARARELFTVEHMVDGTMAAYERLLGVKGR